VSPSSLDLGPILEELKLQIFAHDVKAPVNHRASFWVEVWRDGKLDPTASFGHYLQPPRERPLHGRFSFSIMDGEAVNSPKSRWTMRWESYNAERKPGLAPSGGGSSTQIRWIDDPLKGNGLTNRSGHSDPLPQPIDRGRTYTLHALFATRGQGGALVPGAEPAEMTKTIPVAVFLRARIERVPTGRLVEWGSSGNLSVPPEPLKD